MQRNLIFLACFFICAATAAQQYPFVHYTPKDGLVNSRVKKAYQDSKGRMYFITYGGLSVYDGVRFRNYTTQNGLISELVNDVLEVGNDSLLVAVNTCGLNILANGMMKTFALEGDTCPVINQFLKSHDRNIYISTDNGLYILKRNRIEKLPAFLPLGKEPLVYLGAITDYKDFIVFSTNDLRDNKGLFVYSKKLSRITDALEQLPVHNLKRDRAGIIWVSTTSSFQNLDTLALAAGKLKLRQPYTLMGHRQFPPGNINFNMDNEPLIAAGPNEIIRMSKNGKNFSIAFPDNSTSKWPDFFIDREDIMWMYHDENGIYKLPNTKLQTTQKFLYENKSGIRVVRAFSDSSFCIVMHDRQWVLVTVSGIQRFSIRPSFDGYPLQYNKPHLYAFDDHNLYIAAVPAAKKGILQFKKILSLPDTSEFTSESAIDPFGNLVIFEKRHISVIKENREIFTYPTSQYNLVHGMYIDKNQLLRLITRGNGLMIFSFLPGEPSRYLQKEAEFVNELNGASPRCMAVDKNEIMWIGTRHDGLFAFQYKNKQLRKLYEFSTKNGLTDNFVTSVACDADNNVIIGMQTGIDRLIKTGSGYRLENITKANNIFSYINYVWTDELKNAFAHTNTGTVFQIEPVQPAATMNEPQLLIEEMKVNGKSFPFTTVSNRLNYYQRDISFSVAAPTFIDEKQVKYSYRLEGGASKEWSDTSSLADISLLNLSPGNYTFRVRAFFPSTSYGSKETTFSFVIMPPWWQTWWFRIIAGLLIIGLLIIGIRFYYRRKLEKQRMILEKQQAVEQERTRIAADMHDDLGAGLTKIKYITEHILEKTDAGERVQPELEKLKNFSSELLESMGEIIWAVSEKNNLLSATLYYLRSYAVNYCEENTLDCGFEIPENFKDRIVSGNIRRNIFLLLKESLHNIVKHAGAKTVTIIATVTEKLELIIKDDGKGFSENGNSSKGNGLINMKKRVQELNGFIRFENNKGTTVIIHLPFTP